MARASHLENYNSIASAFLEFLTVSIHLILFERDIYPARSFQPARKYNYPVRQNRHPAVCKFIDDAVAAVRVQLMKPPFPILSDTHKCTVASVSVILLSPAQSPLERYVFSTVSFPVVGAKEHFIPFVLASESKAATTGPTTGLATTSTAVGAVTDLAPAQPQYPAAYTAVADLHAQYTAVLERLGSVCSSLAPLPQESTFTLAIEMRQTPRGEPPIGWPMPFVPAEPGLQRGDGDESVLWTVVSGAESEPATTQETSSGLWSSSGDTAGEKGRGPSKAEKADGQTQSKEEETPQRSLGKRLGGTRAVPVRNIEAGPFVMEVWVEQNDEDSEIVGSGYKSASVEDE